MFKLLVALSLFVAIQGQIPGGFTDRPDLVQSPVTRTMVRLALSELASTSNVHATPGTVVSVASQVVNGVNYRIVFTARPAASDALLTCTAKVYQPLSGAQKVSNINCV